MKSFLKSFFLILIISGAVIGLNTLYPNHLQYLNNKLIDHFFNARTQVHLTNKVIIVDIDDKSLTKVGQWPWSRKKMAILLKNLLSMKPACVGYSIIFSEPDRTSPHLYSKNGQNYDKIFASVIENSDIPVVLGYSFLSKPLEGENYETPYIPAMITKEVDDTKLQFYNPPSSLLNIPIIQDSSYSSGFLNSIANKDGRIIYMPLIMKHKGEYFTSLALELIRTIYGAREIKVKYNSLFGNYISFADIKIPVNENGSLFVNYSKTGIDNIKHISAVDILTNNISQFNPKDIKNKIILIGSNAQGLSLMTPTPFDIKISSINLQANIIEDILSDKYLLKPTWEHNFNYTATFLLATIIIIFTLIRSVLINFIISISCMIGSYFVLQYLFNEFGYIINSSYIIETILFSLIVSIVSYFLQSRKDISTIKGKFASKVSQEVMDDLLNSSTTKKSLSSKWKNVAIFFSDIKGFTKITEQIDNPHQLAKYINRYMDYMTKNIMQNKGTVDKFMGDAIMAYWNAPFDVEDYSDKAVTSALEQIQLLNTINKLNQQDKMPLVDIRIGINTGDAFVGEVGGELRNDYTVMGKAVNHAAVLEQVGKYYGTNIIISESVKEQLKKSYTMYLLDIIQIEGTSDAFNIYSVIQKGQDNINLNKEIAKLEKAIMLYREAKFTIALELFEEINNKDIILNKRITNIYIKRCKENLAISVIAFNPIQSINKSIISNH